MNYWVIELAVGNEMVQEILVAELSAVGYESFEETPNGLTACIVESGYEEATLKRVCEQYEVLAPITIASQTLTPDQNWNKKWEDNFFTPITIKDKVLVKATFHETTQDLPYTITINPKLAFGTGHHETTSLVLEQMLSIDFQEQQVLDYGCGTGILAIMASQLGAKSVLAIDYDHWSYENTFENLSLNNIENVTPIHGEINALTNQKFDTILANINKNVLLNTMSNMIDLLKKGGQLLMSGILLTDKTAMIETATNAGLSLQHALEKGEWVCLHFQKA
ncbi:MAG: 50S ribosomal protein L11 methyltransferase [Chitinophagales bacterium]